MIGSLASLRDWVRDQVHEVRHLTVLAVLAPPTVPTGRLAPTAAATGTQVPVCQFDSLRTGPEPPCELPAVVVASIQSHGTIGCRRVAVTLCAPHLHKLRVDALEWSPARCDRCGMEMLRVEDWIRTVQAL